MRKYGKWEILVKYIRNLAKVKKNKNSCLVLYMWFFTYMFWESLNF